MDTDLRTEVTALQAELKKLQKVVKKLVKQQKAADEDPNAPKKVSGFSKPMVLSEALEKFLGVDHGTQLARTEVTKRINSYVKEHSLQNPENKRELILDEKLRTIIDAGDEQVTFFNLQRYMSPHYSKPPTDAAPETTDAAAPAAPAAEGDKKVVKKIVKKVVKAKA